VTVGRILLPRPFQETIEAPQVDSRSALAEALVAYLRCVEFVRWGGGQGGEDVRFRIERVYREWPEPDQMLDYPAATVLDLSDVPLEAHNFTPTPLEETYEVFGPCSVLWKLAEVASTFQVDLWANDEPTREAIAAGLPGAFAFGENQYGIVVEGPETYWSRPVRLTLLSLQRMDAPGSIYVRERRLMAKIRAEVDEVSLRRATLASVAVSVPEVGEQVSTVGRPAGLCQE